MNACIHRAAVTPSTGRWSTDNVTVMTRRTRTLPLRTTGASRAAPTARIEDCGGLMIAANSSVPNIPRLVMVATPPCRSCCRSRPVLARSACSLTWAAMAVTDSRSAPRITGVTSPSSVAMATDRSTAEKCRTASGVQITFIAGTRVWACAAALITRSFTRDLDRAGGVQPLAQPTQPLHVRGTPQVEVRSGLLALGQPGRDGPAQPRVRDVAYVCAGLGDHRGQRGRDGGRRSRDGGWPGRGRRIGRAHGHRRRHGRGLIRCRSTGWPSLTGWRSLTG